MESSLHTQEGRQSNSKEENGDWFILKAKKLGASVLVS
jgi:hypothetical protein